MRIDANQIARIQDAQERLAALLKGDPPLDEVAECLEDAANSLLDVSEEISQNILEGRRLLIQPIQGPRSRCP
jgi:hypothetical protein